MKQLKAIIVDDERLARKELQSILAPYPEINVVAEASTVHKAIEVIEKEKPDVVFLDIILRGGSGFDVLKKTAMNFKVVFVTAFHKYAHQAREANAVDFLLKPVHPDRLDETMKRLFED